MNDEEGAVDNLWILSRKPNLSAELLQQALDKIEPYFNIHKLKTVNQEETFCDRKNKV